MNKSFYYCLCSFLAAIFLLPYLSRANEQILPECFRGGSFIDVPWSGEPDGVLTVNKGDGCNFFRPGTIRYPFHLSGGFVLFAGEDKYHLLGDISVADQSGLFSIRPLSMLDGSFMPPAPVYFRNHVHVDHRAEFEVKGAGALADFENKVLLQNHSRVITTRQAKMVIRDKLEIQSGSRLEVQHNGEILLEESSDTVVSGFDEDGSPEPFSQMLIHSSTLTANGAVTIGTGGIMHVWKDGEATFNAPIVLQDSPDAPVRYLPRLILGDPKYESYFSTMRFNDSITLGQRSFMVLYKGRAVFHDGIQIHYPVSHYEGWARLQLMEGADAQIDNAEILIEQTPDCYIAPGEGIWLIEATESHVFSGIRLVSNRPLSTFSLKNKLFKKEVAGWYAYREKIPGGFQSMVSGHRMRHLAGLLDTLSQSDLSKPLSNSERGLLAQFDRCAEPGCLEVLLARHEAAIRHYIDLQERKTNSYRGASSIKIIEIKIKKVRPNSFKQFVELIVNMRMEQHIALSGILLCLIIIARHQIPVPVWPVFVL